MTEKKNGSNIVPIILVSLVVAGVLFFKVVLPRVQSTPDRVDPKIICFVNQKTIEGALEMYEMDTNKELKKLTPEVWKELTEKGYIQRIPEHMKTKETTEELYKLKDGKLYCTVHGRYETKRR